MIDKNSKKQLEKIKGKKLIDIQAGWGEEITLIFEDGTKADINTCHYPDGTISEIIIDIGE